MNLTLPEPTLTPQDPRHAAAACRDALAPALSADWTVRAGELEWTCRRTLDHIVDTLALYTASVGSRATGRIPLPRNGDPEASLEALLTLVEIGAAVLAEVASAAPPGTRIFHPAGLADISGYLAIACEEILVHAHDITLGLDCPFSPPNDLVVRVLARLFPWAPTDVDPWPALQWATGRIGLPDHPRLGPDWYWHCAPLAEWDGTVKKRLAPPAWR